MKPTVTDIKAAGGYSILYADPAWPYVQGGRGAARNQYDTPPLEQIFALPVGDLASKDAVLFLWATMPLLPDALECGRRWGFEFKTTAFTWVKYHEPSGKPCMGGGMWTRANVELCLLFVRGEPPRRVSRAVRQLVEEWPDPEAICVWCKHERSKHLGQVLRAPRGAHSAKPREVRERIDALMGPDLPRVELFARERAAGWDCWGAEAEGGSDFQMGGI